jgi:hypothetical protein
MVPCRWVGSDSERALAQHQSLKEKDDTLNIIRSIVHLKTEVTLGLESNINIWSAATVNHRQSTAAERLPDFAALSVPGDVELTFLSSAHFLFLPSEILLPFLQVSWQGWVLWRQRWLGGCLGSVEATIWLKEILVAAWLLSWILASPGPRHCGFGLSCATWRPG